MDKTALLNELKTILTEYADDRNYSQTTRSLDVVSNGHKDETFYEFNGDSSGAKLGLEIVDLLLSA